MGRIIPCRYSIWRTGNSARLENRSFCSGTSDSSIAFGPVSHITPPFSSDRMRPRFIRCFTLSAGQPQRM
ncbi:MAG: hypothetical protein ABIH66_06730 [bacterium]